MSSTKYPSPASEYPNNSCESTEQGSSKRPEIGGLIHEKLSDREFQILCLFGEGKTIKQIAEVLSLSSPTVSTYRARILSKMEMKTTAELVRYAIEHDISKPR